jgi:hypothetical protein
VTNMTEQREPERPLPIRILRVIVRFVVTVAVVIYAVLDDLLFPLFRPFVALLSRLKLFQTIAALINRLPPYGVLVLLAVPFILIEPAKIYAVVLAAEGHVISGAALLIVAQILSIFTCDRIYHTGKGQLMKIGWFKRLMTWLKGLKDRVLDWAKATPAWQAVKRMIAAARGWIAGVIRSVR